MIRLYDTMARAKRAFVPREADRITMYVCGPTVYGRAHIGNARPAVVFDTLRRLLEHQFPDRTIVYARNVTDVDDKIIAAAEAEGVEPAVITDRYESFYLEDMRALGVRDPDIAPHATAEVAPMIAMIDALIARGNAYAAEGHVLFSVPSDSDYGALSRRDRDAMVAGARVEVAPYKRDPTDFILWKPSADGVIGWESPWGRGRPGWHIECSAMIRAHLGETIDIHGGGLDLVFPHHENELAQSRCAHGAPLANHWVHNGFVDMGAEKMSKSLGNVVTVDELLGAGHKGEVLRLCLLSAHYRKPLDWSDALIRRWSETFDVWCSSLGDYFDSLQSMKQFVSSCKTPAPDAVAALGNDLNTPLFISILQRQFSELKLGDFDALGEFIGTANFIGIELSFDKTASFGYVMEELYKDAINAKVAQRNEAKKARDFATADRIRDELKADGILLEDGPSGTTWRRA